MNKTIKKHKELFLLNYLLIVIYIVVFIHLKMDIDDKIMFSTVDSLTYWATGQEFYKFSEKGFSELRPFLYPLILVFIHKISGIFGIWIMQLIFWIISINLLFLSIKQMTNNRILSFIGSLILALNISYIVLTVHALTEITTIVLLSALIYFISCNVTKVNTLKFFHGSLFILVLLAVVKPVFFVPVVIMLIIVLPFFYLKKYIQKPKSLITLLFIIVPLLFQITMMKAKYNTFSFSNIGSKTISAYLLAQGVQQNNTIDLDSARAITLKYSPEEVFSYIVNNKVLYIKIYFQNFKNNIKALPCFIFYPNSFWSTEIVSYMEFINTFYYYIHIVFVVPVLVFIYFAFRRKQKLNFYLVPLVIASFLTYYILFISPISFGEGDRLVIISLPVWIFLYSLILNGILKKSIFNY